MKLRHEATIEDWMILDRSDKELNCLMIMLLTPLEVCCDIDHYERSFLHTLTRFLVNQGEVLLEEHPDRQHATTSE